MKTTFKEDDVCKKKSSAGGGLDGHERLAARGRDGRHPVGYAREEELKNGVIFALRRVLSEIRPFKVFMAKWCTVLKRIRQYYVRIKYMPIFEFVSSLIVGELLAVFWGP